MLVVVSRDLAQAVKVPQIAATLQAALDDWNYCKPKLEAVYQRLNDGLEGAFAFDQTACHSPLPPITGRTAAPTSIVELVRKARGAEMPESFWHDPLMYRAAPMPLSRRTARSARPTRPGASIWKASWR